MNYDIWMSSEDPNSIWVDPFQVWQTAPPPRNIGNDQSLAWVDGYRTWSGPQTSNESASTLLKEYIRWIMIFWLSSEDQNSPRGDPFQVWQMHLPPLSKWEMIRCTCSDSCRMWSGPQTSNESASTLSDEFIGWIMIFLMSSEGQNSPRGNPFQVWQIQLPLPEKWEMIRCACGDGCRIQSGPLSYNRNASTLSNDYIEWIMIFLPSSENHNSPWGNPFQVWQMQLPLPETNEKWSDALELMALGCDPAPRCPMSVHHCCQMITLDESLYFECPQRTRTHPGATLSRFNKCSSPSQKNGKWSDALELMAVGCDLFPRRPMRVNQCCQMNTLDELWYFYCSQRTRSQLGVTLSRFDKCSSPSLLQRSD